MSTISSRWSSRLVARSKLLRVADANVRYWSRRAGSRQGLRKLREARAHLTLRRHQVAEAEKILARHRLVTEVSARGVAFVAGFEGFLGRPYLDTIARPPVWTQGYGETQGVGPHSPPVTRAQAARKLKQHLDHVYLPAVLAAAKAGGLTLRQHEADALTSAAYNLGPGVFDKGHTLGDALRAGSRSRAAAALLLYDKAGSRSVTGLTRRRREERAMFLGS